MRELIDLFLGNATFPQWVYGAFLGLFGFILLKLINFERRTDKDTKFDFGYWWKDNRVEFFMGVIIFYVLFRFHEDVVGFATSKFDIPLLKDRYLYLFLFGLFLQIIVKKLRPILRIRNKQYPSGEYRAEHVGSRPDDR